MIDYIEFKNLRNLKREDIVDFGDKSHIKKMQIGVWDADGGYIDQNSLVPEILRN